MFGKTLVARYAVFGAADRPVQDHARNHVRMRDGKRRDRRAAHAAAHQMRALDAEMVEQAFALRDEMPPGDALDPPAGLAAFAAVEQDAAKTLWQMIEQFYPGVAAKRRPRFDHGVEAAGRVHQQRRSGANHLVARGDAVDDRARHGHPLICRPARASAISAVNASSAALAVFTYVSVLASIHFSA